MTTVFADQERFRTLQKKGGTVAKVDTNSQVWIFIYLNGNDCKCTEFLYIYLIDRNFIRNIDHNGGNLKI